MKSKPVRKPEVEQEDDDEVEVAAGGPGIASNKKSKMTIVLLSSVFATLVIYFFFFKDKPKTAENLDAVEVPQVAAPVAMSDKSPFEIDVAKEASQENSQSETFDAPQEPAVPALPDLPKNEFEASSKEEDASEKLANDSGVASTLSSMRENDLQNQIVQMQQQIDQMQQQMVNAFEANKTPIDQQAQFQKKVVEIEKRVSGLSGQGIVTKEQQDLLQMQAQKLQQNIAEIEKKDEIPLLQKQQIVQQAEQFEQKISDALNQTKLSFDDKMLIKKEAEKVSGRVRDLRMQAEVPELQYQIKQFDQKLEEVVSGNAVPIQQRKALKLEVDSFQDRVLEVSASDKTLPEQREKIVSNFEDFSRNLGADIDKTKLSLDDKNLLKKEIEKIGVKARGLNSSAEIPNLQYQVKQFDEKLTQVVQKDDLPQLQKKSLQQPSLRLKDAVKIVSKDKKIPAKKKDELRYSSDALEKKVNEVLDNNKLSAEQKRPLKQEVKALQEQVRAISNPSEVAELRQQIKNIEEKIDDLSEVKKVPPSQRKILQKQADDLDKKIAEVAISSGASGLPKEQQDKLSQQIEDLSKQIKTTSTQTQLPQLQQQIQKLDSQISDLSKNSKLPQDQSEQFKNGLRDLSLQIAAISKQNEVPLLREDIKQLQAQIDFFAKSGNPSALQPIVIQQSPGQPPQVSVVNQAPASASTSASVSIPEQAKRELNPRYAPIVVFSGGVGGPALGVGYDKNITKLKEDEISKLQKTQPGVVATYIADRSHTIAQGKILTAVLETAIDTQVPGSVRAIVSRDVYAEAGNEVLIPRGSRLFGAYSSQITRGQGRVQIGWKRLIRPDGVDLTISFIAADQFGRSGITGEVDNKYDVVIANSLLSSLLTVGGVAAAQALVGNNTTTTTTNPTQGSVTTTGNATNQALYDVSKTILGTANQIIGNSLNSNPVIRVPQGTRISVIVNSDIMIPSMKK